jgi:hypothetical protein
MLLPFFDGGALWWLIPVDLVLGATLILAVALAFYRRHRRPATTVTHILVGPGDLA